MKRIWIKLFVELLDDPKMGRLPDWLWRRAIELFLLAGENGNDGLLQPVDDIAWRLRVSVEKLTEALQALSEVGVVHESPDGWVVTHFKERQWSESLERVRRYRNAKSNAQGNEVVAEDESPSSSESESLEGGGAGEETKIPDSPAQAMQHSDIQAFKSICGRIPGTRDYAVVIETIRLLRKAHGDKLAEAIKPYWLAWSTRTNKQTGKPYDPASLVWLCEWAVNGQIPTNGNGAGASAKPAIDEKSVQRTTKELADKWNITPAPPPETRPRIGQQKGKTS
jgi:hypothetical protein